MSDSADSATKARSKAKKGSRRNLTQGTGSTKKPCGRCRALHLRCVWTSSDSQASCARCERSGNDCVLGTKKTRFRHAVFPSHGQQEPGSEKSHSFIDMPTPIEEDKIEEVENIDHDDQQLRLWDGSQVNAFYAGLWGTRSLTNEYQYTNFSKNLVSPETLEEPNDITMAMTVSPRLQQTGTISDSAQLFNESITITSTDKAYLEYVLMRYFCEDLAPWLDWCDPDRHFTLVIPQKARESGPLRNSVLTFAARSLARNRRYRNNSGNLEWRGHLLPDLDGDVAVFYHNESIRDLLRLSMDSDKLHDELLLAAVITLRNDEEIGFHTDEEHEDQQLFRHLANCFIGSQLPASLARQHISPGSETSKSITRSQNMSQVIQSHASVGNGLRDACIWTAFRQDIHAAMLTNQPLLFPLTRFEAFRQCHPASDAVWANRMVLLCADVTEFAYGSDSTDDGKVLPDYDNRDRWVELKHREQMITKLLPATFQPIFYREPSLLNGVFPEAWYQDMCVICGLTYIELARLLLEKFNPARLPHLDPTSHTARRTSMAGAKKILLRLCGISLSNDHCPPSLINACLGIALVGEYFDDAIERKGLLNVLALMYDRHSYPALSNRIADSLRKSWSSEERLSES